MALRMAAAVASRRPVAPIRRMYIHEIGKMLADPYIVAETGPQT